MNINIHIHDHSRNEKDLEILETLFLIIKNQKKIMAKQDEFDAYLARLDAATSKIAADLTTIIASEKDNISADSLSKLGDATAALEKIGSDNDPSNPPAPTPAPTPAPGDGTGGTPTA